MQNATFQICKFLVFIKYLFLILGHEKQKNKINAQKLYFLTGIMHYIHYY